MLPSANDMKMAARDVVRHLETELGHLSPERFDEAMNVIQEMVRNSDTPPAITIVSKPPCKHGYENSFWCPRCDGRLTEDFRSTAPERAG